MAGSLARRRCILTGFKVKLALLGFFTAALSIPDTICARPHDVQIVRGSCSRTSHTSEGPTGSDLTKKQSRFFCNSAVISFFDDHNDRVMVQFSEKESHRINILGFAGRIAPNGIMMNVTRVYFTPSVPTEVDDGTCKFFFKGKNMTGIFCGARVDENSRRSVAIVAFDADQSQ
jgi:hypothetical protein